MLVSCQVCNSNVSDQAAACPKCGSEKAAFLGPESYCYECGASIRTAYQSCGNCGAPRSREAISSEVNPLKTEKQPEQIEPVLQAPEREPPRRYETAKPKDNSGIGRLVGGLLSTLVAVVIGIFVSGFVREMLNQQRVEENTVSVAELEASFANTEEGRLFEFIKAELPEDYNAMMNRLVGFVNSAEGLGSEKESFDAGYAEGAEMMDDFLQENWKHLQTAPDAKLIEMGSATARLFSVLELRDVALCASLARGVTMQQADKFKLQQYGVNVVDLDIAVVGAISAGKKSPFSPRAVASEADWDELMARVYPELLPDSFDELLNTEDPTQMSDQALCDMTSAMMSEVMKDTPERQAMWIASMNAEEQAAIP